MMPVPVPMSQTVPVPCRIPMLAIMSKMTRAASREVVMAAIAMPGVPGRGKSGMMTRPAIPGRMTGARRRVQAGSDSRNVRLGRQLAYPGQQVGRGLLLGSGSPPRRRVAGRHLSLDKSTCHHQRVHSHHPSHGGYHTAGYQNWELKLRLRTPPNRCFDEGRPAWPCFPCFYSSAGPAFWARWLTDPVATAVNCLSISISSSSVCWSSLTASLSPNCSASARTVP